MYLFGEHERIELTHRAQDRDLFAHGALVAARWLAQQPAGFSHIEQCLGFGGSVIAFTFLIAAEVVDMRGTVEVRPPSTSDFHAAARGDQADEGSRVRTGPSSEATLRFSDGSQVKVSERSSMLVSHVSNRRKRARSVVVLFCGRLWAKITKHGGEAAFDVATPNAVAGVRGTQFTTTVADDGSARVQVDEGTVAVSNDDKSKSVSAGQGAEAMDTGVRSPPALPNDDQLPIATP